MYVRNVFDGRITTLIGVILIGQGIHRGFTGGEFIEVSSYVLGGIAIAGFKDPSLPKTGNPPQP
jgi:hypothetical protein